MAAVLVRMALRQALAGKNLLERKLAPAVCSSFLEQSLCSGESSTNRCCAPQFQSAVRQMSNSKRDIHQQKTKTAVSQDDSDYDSGSDSDDEKPKKRESSRARSHFWRRKMRTLHNHLDVNKDGVISYDDFRLLGERFAQLGHLTDSQKKEFQVVLERMWLEQWGEISPYNLVDVEKYLAEMYHVLEDKSLRKKVHHFLPYLFKAVDKDRSGEISVQEFKLFFKCLGMKNDDAVVSFAYIDVNEDGKISLEEFVKLGRDFFLTDDQTKPSKHFWGPLED